MQTCETLGLAESKKDGIKRRKENIASDQRDRNRPVNERYISIYQTLLSSEKTWLIVLGKNEL